MSVFNTANLPTLDKKTTFLVVDDFEIMRKVTANQLRQLGAEKIFFAKDGNDALRVLKLQNIDLVLSDWNMPNMDGLELLQTIRADPHLFAMPVVMITAEAERPRVEKAIANGVTSMILKPYSPSQLMARVSKALVWKPRKTNEPTSAPASYAASGKDAAENVKNPGSKTSENAERATILLVDDTPDNLMLLANLLKDEFRVRTAQNGPKALEICTSDNPPDLVLLDIMMPGMDGFEVAKRMREHPNSETIPVIFVTAMTSSDARLRGLDLGAVDYITKPIDPEVLKPRVRNFIRYVQMRKNLQSEYDSMVETAQLREDVDQITRHDMKGPLAGILGLIQGMMDDKNSSPKQIEQYKMVEETALQVLNMINLSAELFKIESGRFELNAQPVKVGDILRRIAEINRVTYSDKQLIISVDTDAPVGEEMPQALGDAMLCYSLFQNLIKNACEAAPPSSKMSITLLDQTPLRIVFENQGAVPQDIRERFFDKFVTSGKKGGTGLGTYSAKLLSQAQKGNVELAVNDATNTTTITVVLPRLNTLADNDATTAAG